MCYRLFLALVISMVMIGCSERYGGSMYPVPHIPDERPASPNETDVINDLNDAFDGIVSAELVEEVHSVDSHVYFVKVDNDGEMIWFKVTYYWVSGEWVCIPDEIEI